MQPPALPSNNLDHLFEDKFTLQQNRHTSWHHSGSPRPSPTPATVDETYFLIIRFVSQSAAERVLSSSSIGHMSQKRWD
ncbi:unnamed protein product [Lactuca virosa]|uniref:Uncharacterized protein n=1 Tax=Lactuca virosa TaxID=75947 RepID=A0AAU9MHA0_9ASTR|nr:unnamed protein product [Lactuca virosa]